MRALWLVLVASAAFGKSPTITKEMVVEWVLASPAAGCAERGDKEVRMDDHYGGFLLRDLDGDGKAEAVVTAFTCMSGTGGPDIHEVLKLDALGKIKPVPFVDNDKTKLPLPTVGNTSSYLGVDERGRIYRAFGDAKVFYALRDGQLIGDGVKHPPLGKPSFACRGDKLTPVEIAICWNEEASKTDAALGEEYKALKAKLPEAKRRALETEQRAWLAKRDEECVPYKWHYDCLAKLYEERRAALRGAK